jgi:hypothetical protein
VYFLSKDCYVCNTQDYWIILSASRDRYSCVTHRDLLPIGNRLHGWQDRRTAEHFSLSGAEADTLIDSLISKGIITASPSDGKPFAESECPVCERAVASPETDARVKHSILCVARLFLACAKIDWHLRNKNLFRILARIERHRLRVRSFAAIRDVADVSGPIAVFKDLRPLYPRPYLCLFDSLALLEFLASYRYFPRVVFGVIADPFQAHCWLQEGSVVINDDLERVTKYKPILSV